jgi:hypothetical protein
MKSDVPSSVFCAQNNRHSVLNNDSVSRNLLSEYEQLNSRNVITILKFTLTLMISTSRSFLSKFVLTTLTDALKLFVSTLLIVLWLVRSHYLEVVPFHFCAQNAFP